MIVKIFRLLVLVVWLSLLPALTACNTSPLPISDSLERIIQRGKLVIATDPVYPPQSAKVEGEIRPVNTRCSPTEFTANQFTGFDVDVAVELARRLGVEPCFATPYWDQITAGNWGDHWDIHVGSMSITSERMEIFYFPQPYYTSPSAFFVQQDDDRFMQPADLAGKKIGVCLDCSYQYYLEGSLELPGVEMDFVVKDPIIVAYNDEMAALETLSRGRGRLDAILTAEVSGADAIHSGMALKQLGEAAYNTYVSVAIDRRNNRNQLPFVQKINELIQEMHRDGFLRECSLKYYGIDLATAAGQFDITRLGQIP